MLKNYLPNKERSSTGRNQFDSYHLPDIICPNLWVFTTSPRDYETKRWTSSGRLTKKTLLHQPGRNSWVKQKVCSKRHVDKLTDTQIYTVCHTEHEAIRSFLMIANDLKLERITSNLQDVFHCFVLCRYSLQHPVPLLVMTLSVISLG